MKLSVVIAALNEPCESLRRTISTCLETSEARAEVVLVDDCSSTPLRHFLPDFKVTLVENTHRCGVGPSRTVGVHYSSGEYVLIIDAHCVFTPGWYDEAVRRLEGRPKTVHCATCLALDSKHMDVNAPVAEYHGGTINVCGVDKGDASKWQILESVWNPPGIADDAEIASIMGAAYFVPRQLFLDLQPLRFLRHWGKDEGFLALKAWLSGGDVRLMRNVKIGHKFTLPKEKQPFSVDPGCTTYNTLLAIHTLAAPLAAELEARLQANTEPREWFAAYEMMKRDWHLFAQEKAFNQAIFKHDIRWFMDRFGLAMA